MTGIQNQKSEKSEKQCRCSSTCTPPLSCLSHHCRTSVFTVCCGAAVPNVRPPQRTHQTEKPAHPAAVRDTVLPLRNYCHVSTQCADRNRTPAAHGRCSRMRYSNRSQSRCENPVRFGYRKLPLYTAESNRTRQNSTPEWQEWRKTSNPSRQHPLGTLSLCCLLRCLPCFCRCSSIGDIRHSGSI